MRAMLPPDFHWAPRYRDALYDRAVFAGTTAVVYLIRRIDGDYWYALLDVHLPDELRTHRPCTSFEAGQRGVELWVDRHQARIRAELDHQRAEWAKRNPHARPPRQHFPTRQREER